MAFFSLSLYNLILCSLLLFTLSSVFVSSTEFQVGGTRGWALPTGDERESYDDWASRNRFHIGDSIHFKYENDSVLVVSKASFIDCNVEDPISEYTDGDTTFEFDRYGYFYFISGDADHCNAGQKLVVRVMVHPPLQTPAPVGAPESGDGWDSVSFGPTPANSTDKVTFTSYFITVLGGMLIIIYLLM